MTKSLHSDAAEELKKLLVDARKKAGLTQQQVADALHTQQSYVAKVERGERRIDVAEFMEFAKVLGLVPWKLLKKLETTLAAKD